MRMIRQCRKMVNQLKMKPLATRATLKLKVRKLFWVLLTFTFNPKKTNPTNQQSSKIPADSYIVSDIKYDCISDKMFQRKQR